jgi:hypothetical protein
MACALLLLVAITMPLAPWLFSMWAPRQARPESFNKIYILWICDVIQYLCVVTCEISVQ